MAPRQRRYPLEAFARRGEEVYQQVRPLVEAGNQGKVVALDVDSGAFEVGDDEKAACDRLLARCPDAWIWCAPVGYPAVPRAGRRRQPHYPPEEYARRGEETYQQEVRPLVEAGNHGRIVAIDIDSGAFELADDERAACDRLFARYPDAQIWCVRVGYPAVHKIGGGWGKTR